MVEVAGVEAQQIHGRHGPYERHDCCVYWKWIFCCSKSNKVCSVDSYHSEHSNSHAPARTNVFSPTNDSVRRAAYSSSPLMHNAFSRVANWHVVQTGTNLFLRVSFQLPPGEAYRLHLHASRFSTIASFFLATFTYIALLLRHQHT